ncbi:MAG: response regulator [Deltaproteobacteria bacterium]|nr:response regulator [Deltaproteobacteria bacterium]
MVVPSERTLCELAPIGVGLIAIREVRYVYVNQAYAAFLGLTVEEILAADPYELWTRVCHPADFEAERALFQAMVDGRQAGYSMAKRFVRRGGEIRWGLVQSLAIRAADGTIEHLVGYLTDIHAHRVASPERQPVDEARHAHKLEALGQLAAGVAHDFNNRLVIILGHAELMREQLAPGDPLREHLDQILASAQRSAELTRQLLAFSRRQVLAPRAFDLTATVDNLRKMLSRLLGERIELVSVLGAKGPIFADPGQIEQVLVNLAVNARDAMPQGGRLTLTTADVDALPPEVSAPGQGPWVELAVSDTGHGIAEDELPRIFEPFFTTKPTGSGTGLGLSTVEGIVRQSGGVVTVQSRPGLGTTFRVFLPRASALPAPESAPVRVARGPVGSHRILVCDDDADVRRLLVDVVRLHGHEVLSARNGEHALEVARAAGPLDLVVCDVVMPGLDGPEVVTRLRHDRPTLAAVFVTGQADAQTLAAATALEGARILPKPFMPADLLRTIVAALDERAAVVDPQRLAAGG